ncbi:hypothetical protein KVP10_08445 [Candidimonas humi]|uniref:Uncharacterized protein n=1 Tax=Candidimonas humi TaxID=683355 RepID=A0ABV8NXD9_9BURK|nr:hypothetical protein [Candidimonas humi]MBV6304915.1 hypothetical protein [Candidimonas humi]
MKMYDIEVTIQDEIIEVTQQDDEGLRTVKITPEQAALVCEWILGAANKLIGTEG